MSEINATTTTVEKPTQTWQQPLAIGGWLIAIGIGLVFSLIHNLADLLPETAPLFRREVWTRLTDPSSFSYHPYWKAFIIYNAVVGFVFVLMNIVATILSFGKRRLFPKLSIGFIPLIFLLTLIGYNLAGRIPSVAEKPAYALQGYVLILKFFALHVWIPYFLFAKRVKQTFVN